MSFDPAWEQVHRSMEWGLEADPRFKAFYEANFKDNEGLTFYDIGCGTGAHALWLANRGQKVLAIDGSPTAVLKMMSNRKGHEKITAVIGDATRFTPANNSIDCAVEVAFLECVPIDEALAVMVHIYNALKPGGRIFGRCAASPVRKELNRGDHYHRITSEDDLAVLYSGFDTKIERWEYTLTTADIVCPVYVIEGVTRKA